jgi:D-tagatose-1,6-bisphosphate aldolase subunit GatZ/KbaZ
MSVSYPLDSVVGDHHHGRGGGLKAVCSAHPLVLDETIRHGAEGDQVVLIEATCNQVNQDGGYTGKTPEQLYAEVRGLAGSYELDPSSLVLGGDHLGPNPWRALPATSAMAKAEELVRAFTAAGYTKIHLDASMKCGDDDPDRPLSPETVAERTAALAGAAEDAAQAAGADLLPRYVIGTEVPVPGGGQTDAEGIHVTSTSDLAETIALAEGAFKDRGISAAWERVRCVVAQPGVEFSDNELHEYDRAAAKALPGFIMDYPQLVFEAHSTDYQSPRSLHALVEDHFAVLKVGPGLTFAYREGIYALSMIEDELFGDNASQVRGVLEQAMLEDPRHWRSYYDSDPTQAAVARKYSRSDRSRYYWPVPSVTQAVDLMVRNLRGAGIPEELLSQYLPCQYTRVRIGELVGDPVDLLRDKVREVLDVYHAAVAR